MEATNSDCCRIVCPVLRAQRFLHENAAPSFVLFALLPSYFVTSRKSRTPKPRNPRPSGTPTIRSAQLSDVPELSVLRATLWPDSPAETHAAELTAILAGKAPGILPMAILVAPAPDGTLLGFLEVGLRSHADGCDWSRPVGYVEGWFVSLRARRQGIGAALLRAAEDWSRAHRCTEIASDTQMTNTLSQRVHQALGFEIAERAILFRKSL